MHKNAQRSLTSHASATRTIASACCSTPLEKSEYADDTIVMIWGDHGWHLSQKMHYGKTGLWEESARVPFFVKVPGVTPPNVKCEGVVNLIDMYPTLVELCGLPPNKENDGRTVSHHCWLIHPMKWDEPTLTTYQ